MEAEKWGRRIRAYRKLKGFTQESFSKQLGVSVSIMGEIERGNRLPGEDLLKKIQQTLNISLDELAPPSEDY
ncbi:helix-turn-helix domain-containing protein [Neobacillus massiliamazoniensis]|jgi:transcriptional regulator with XRE-family HTH domain|uniref:Transcriptional regulator n=1 Tax=Neobacillus massiliamazoniensis TaxID=1499688 RepID=A0A0U1P5A2_9BACI|nr:helix-turn-helix transcriptional regulator [Neobacillus massiliamazoniensis]CRK85388.1 transcriptional regulator [Neobacillus massiliamazoniensis]